MNGSTVSNRLIRVDGLVWLLAVEVIGDQLLDARNTGRTTDKNDLVNLRLVNLGVSKDTVDWSGG